MKRSTKLIISATVVASLVGVGSVSYAIWSAGTAEMQFSGSAGVVRTIGNVTVTPSDKSGSKADDGTITMNQLYPVDQSGSYLNYWEFTLSAEVPEGEEAAKFSLSGGISPGSSGAPDTSAKLYWSATAPTATIGSVADKELTASAKELSGLTDNKVYVYMVATGTDAMNVKITLTFSAS